MVDRLNDESLAEEDPKPAGDKDFLETFLARFAEPEDLPPPPDFRKPDSENNGKVSEGGELKTRRYIDSYCQTCTVDIYIYIGRANKKQTKRKSKQKPGRDFMSHLRS